MVGREERHPLTRAALNRRRSTLRRRSGHPLPDALWVRSIAAFHISACKDQALSQHEGEQRYIFITRAQLRRLQWAEARTETVGQAEGAREMRKSERERGEQ